MVDYITCTQQGPISIDASKDLTLSTEGMKDFFDEMA